MNARNVGTIAGREFRSFFDQATAYILLVIFIAVNFFFYFRTVFVTAEATLRPMFELMPWLLLFFVPAVCSCGHSRSREWSCWSASTSGSWVSWVWRWEARWEPPWFCVSAGIRIWG